MMEFSTCIGQNVIQVGNASCSNLNKPSALDRNKAICAYHCNVLAYSCLVTITWCKNLMGQFFILEISDFSGQTLSKAIVRPSLFSRRKGFKRLEMMESVKIGLFWDLSSANFGPGHEPFDGFYLALVCYGEMVLLIGDRKKEAVIKTGSALPIANAAFVARREHVFGKRAFGSRVRFRDEGPVHELTIDCDTVRRSRLVVSIDSEIALLVKHLRWKFRGNQTIWVDGAAVEVSWDLHDWIFGTPSGNAAFVFQTSEPEKRLRSPESGSEQRCEKSDRNIDLGFSLVFCVSEI